jgi:MFS family permease
VIHKSVGLSETLARWVAAANAVSYFFTTTASIAFVDKVGRRPLLMIGAAVMAVAFFGVASGVGIGGALPDHNWPGIVSVVFIWLYFTAFSSGWISIPWLYAAEVNGLSMRGKAASLGMSPRLFLVFPSSSSLTRPPPQRPLATGSATTSSYKPPRRASNTSNGATT